MLNCRSYSNMTECHIPDTVLVNGNTFFSRYYYMKKLKYGDIPVNVIVMTSAYSGCTNLTGSPVCGPNVTSMSSAYENCTNLTGNPVC